MVPKCIDVQTRTDICMDVVVDKDEQASGTQFSALNTHRYCILPKNVKHF
jgi:hypothetical protein